MLFKRKRKSSNIWIQIWRTNLNPALNDSELVLKCNRLNKNQLQKIFIGKVIQIAASWCEVWTQEFFAGWETEANSKNSRKTQSPIKNNNHEVTFYFRVLPFTSWTGIWKYKLKSLGKTRNGSETSRNRGSWNNPGTPSRHPEFPIIPPWRARPIPKQPRPQGFSLKKWVGPAPPIFWGKSPGDEVAWVWVWPVRGVLWGIPGVVKVFRGCSRSRGFGMFRTRSGFFPGILIYIFKFPFSWWKVKLENKTSPHDCYSL